MIMKKRDYNKQYTKHIKKFRRINEDQRCIRCRKPMGASTHHYLCNRCWWLYNKK